MIELGVPSNVISLIDTARGRHGVKVLVPYSRASRRDCKSLSFKSAKSKEARVLSCMEDGRQRQDAHRKAQNEITRLSP